jgi:hypothetical protein
LSWDGKAVKSAYIVWLTLTGVAVFLTKFFGNPFVGETEYRIEYTGKVGTTLWATYNVTDRDKSRENTSEKIIGTLPQTVKFTSNNNSIVSANGSTASREAIKIQIYKNGSSCGSSESSESRITDTIVCR